MSFSALEDGQVKTSDVMSCVRSSRNSAAVTSFGAGPSGPKGFADAVPVPQVGITDAPAVATVRGYAFWFSLPYNKIACPIWRRLLAHRTRLESCEFLR